MGECVHVTKRDAIAIVTIDNPPMNVLNAVVVVELRGIFQELQHDSEVAAVVLTGAGERAFMAGADIKEFPSALGRPGAAAVLAEKLHELMNLIDYFPKPTVAALFGFVLGGGLELAMTCDLRVCDENTQLGLPEIKLGIFPGAGGTQRLSRLVGEARAKEMIFLGEPVSGARAYELGLVNRVVPTGEAVAAATELALTIATRSLPALSRIKQAIDNGLELPLREAVRLEATLFDEIFQTEDSREGVTAFIEKRAPRFRHR